ncbi:UDP-N-acetylmuramate--L-alanine ligase [Paludibacter jiangxiensis]|uniref:UDP-N-acetylmuramate--L-alanine ligase n=1 Tax=Paludibacter jiangxiensis TaxID=681398 RepID=A0A170YPB9_9BACT|nr:UDP-N-acetylmuramate--L-alanine ligase [Paludibacter jiangxiensis]GAT61954.1 UDP-N-acetylmuramate--alanine ligase [Paludibacter jiangxiensis]
MSYQNFYFLGIGGIGMSALARFFRAKGFDVAGYDRTRSDLTQQLEKEGIAIHYEDEVSLIPTLFKQPDNTLVVYTPAVPADHSERLFFERHGFKLLKRAQVLGEITRQQRGICIAGTHGKTTTSTMTAHLLKESHVDCNAFLGGISKNYTTNLLLSQKSDYVVIEADEYDRSFHQLTPYMAVITAADPDHLDIYGTPEAFRESFEHFTSLVREGGYLIVKKGADLTPRVHSSVKCYTYAVDQDADFKATNMRISNGEIIFDFHTPTEEIHNIRLGVPVPVNVENGTAAMALAWLAGATAEELKAGMASFKGIHRRFDIQYKSDKLVFIDDYAHHPTELKTSISSIKKVYGERKVCGIFQPHLYTRTRDFAEGFAEALSLLDEVILLDIYPAREQPIPGVTSQIIFDRITTKKKTLCTKQELLSILAKKKNFDVLATFGAGDIDRLLPDIKQLLEERK